MSIIMFTRSSHCSYLEERESSS